MIATGTYPECVWIIRVIHITTHIVPVNLMASLAFYFRYLWIIVRTHKHDEAMSEELMPLGGTYIDYKLRINFWHMEDFSTVDPSLAF